MAQPASTHSRSHSLLLLQKLLNLRDGASPLTLIIDNLEQTAGPLVAEFILRAKVAKSTVIFLSFNTLRRPRDVDVFVRAQGKSLSTLRNELLGHYPAFDPTSARDKPIQRAVVIVDSLNLMASSASTALATFLTSVATPAVSIVGVYHSDVPVVLPRPSNEYAPHPFTILGHLATAILRPSSLQQEIERQRARNRSVQEPEWGLKEDREGVVIGLESKLKGEEDQRGVVVAMELRRRSGRTVSEKFILTPSGASPGSRTGLGKLSMLTDHVMFASPTDQASYDEEQQEEPESTFNLGLTEKQRKDREGIILPYFDAQTDIGAGEGGRILYEMGREDDFDDEEDEI